MFELFYILNNSIAEVVAPLVHLKKMTLKIVKMHDFFQIASIVTTWLN